MRDPCTPFGRRTRKPSLCLGDSIANGPDPLFVHVQTRGKQLCANTNRNGTVYVRPEGTCLCQQIVQGRGRARRLRADHSRKAGGQDYG